MKAARLSGLYLALVPVLLLANACGSENGTLTTAPTVNSASTSISTQSQNQGDRVTAIFQDDASSVTIADAATILTYLSAPPVLRDDPVALAAATQAMLGIEEDLTFLPVPNEDIIDLVSPANTVDLADAGLVLASAILPEERREDRGELARALQDLLGEDSPRQVRVVPGTGLPGEPGLPGGAALIVRDDSGTIDNTSAIVRTIDNLPENIAANRNVVFPRGTLIQFPAPPNPERALRTASRPRLTATRTGEPEMLQEYSATELGCGVNGDETLCRLNDVLAIALDDVSEYAPGDFEIFYTLAYEGGETIISKFLTIEPLSSNATPATIIVNGTTCTLPDAIQSATLEEAIPESGCEVGSGGLIPDIIQLETDVTLRESIATPNGPSGLNIASPIVIEGNGHTIIRSPDSSPFRIFNVSSLGSLELRQSTVSGGVAGTTDNTYAGGGIFNDGGTVILGAGAVIEGNAATDDGGGIASQQELGMVLLTDGAKVAANTAEGSGGGIAIEDGTLTVQDGARVEDNNSSIRIEGGGGIFSRNAALTVTRGATISSNTSANRGGGIHITEAPNRNTAPSISEGAIVSGNTAFLGGGIYSAPALTVSDGVQITGNIATNSAGGVWVNVGLTVEGEDTTVSNNLAQDGNGGGILLFNTNFTQVSVLDGATISGNTASKSGGGISASTLILGSNGVRLNDNTAGDNGGGARIGNLTLLNDTTISNNSAGDDGGGIYVSSGLTAELEGETPSTTGIRIEGNTAGRGGGIFAFNNDPVFVRETMTIANNSASIAGGGLYTEQPLDLANVIFRNNALTDLRTEGFAIFIDANTDLSESKIENSCFIGNGDRSVVSVFNATTQTLDAQNNWWDADDGPGLIGRGDVINTFTAPSLFNVEPFFTTPPAACQ